MTKLLAAVSAALVLTLSACDLPDRSASTTRVANRHCERATGSLVCADGGPEGPVGTVGDPNVSQTFFGAKGN